MKSDNYKSASDKGDSDVQITNCFVRFEHKDIDLESPDIFNHPLLYMAGTVDFRLTQQERDNLREYLLSGGVLFAEATCGRHSFDRAFRKEVGQMLPAAELKRLPVNHLIFHYPNPIKKVKPRPALARRLEVDGKMEPCLYGMNIKGHLALIYSPYDLSGGWALDSGPYNEGLKSNSAFALGVNILSNVLMQ